MINELNFCETTRIDSTSRIILRDEILSTISDEKVCQFVCQTL